MVRIKFQDEFGVDVELWAVVEEIGRQAQRGLVVALRHDHPMTRSLHRCSRSRGNREQALRDAQHLLSQLTEHRERPA